MYVSIGGKKKEEEKNNLHWVPTMDTFLGK